LRNLSDNLISQIFAQGSNDPFLMLVRLTHTSFSDIYLVNNIDNVTSDGNVHQAFPMRVTLPVDDGETQREVALEFDNVALELIDEIRSVSDFIDVRIQMVLASDPDVIEIEIGEMKIRNIQYDQNTISAKLFIDDFLNIELTSEKYLPTNFPGLF